MTIQKTAVQSGAEAFSLPVQPGPVKDSKRFRRSGFHRAKWKRRGAALRRRGSASPLLDSMVVSACTDTVTDKASRKRRRAYHRLRTGLSYHYGKRLRFLTLTLVKESKNDIHKCFRAFKERVRRLTPNKLKRQDVEGFFTDVNMRRYFGKEENWNKLIRFEYFSVIINGERPHMHILYFGNWLPHAWLKKVWREITGDSDIVDIRTTKEKVNDEKRLAGYVLAQYAVLQEGDIRFQMSQGWTWRGMVRDWKTAVKNCTKLVHGKYVVQFKVLLAYWVEVIRSKKTNQMLFIEMKPERKKRKKYPIH